MPRIASLPAYSSAQNEYLRLNYPTAPQAAILVQFPGRHWKMVQKQASRLKCGQRCPGRTSVSKLWPMRFTDFLRGNYPEFGALPEAAFTGLSVVAVRSRANYLGISFRHRANVPKTAKMPRAPRKAAPPRAPRAAVPKPDLVLPVKLRPTLTNLNASKEARKKAERAAKAAVGITAEQVRRLGPNDPARRAYTLGGVAGWQQWKAAQ